MDKRVLLSIGTIIEDGQNRYRIVDNVGYGGSALIYRAEKYEPEEDLEKGKTILLKEIYPVGENFTRNDRGQVISENSKQMEKFYTQLDKESLIGSKIKDKSFLVCNLVKLKRPCLAGNMARLGGMAEMPDMSDSAQLLAGWLECSSDGLFKRNFKIGQILKVIGGIAETLEKIHKAGYIYCDFNVNNIFLLKDTFIAVFIDFGSAVECEYGKEVELSTYIPATWGYRAPELLHQVNIRGSYKRAISHSADVYALSVLLYEMACGSRFAESYDEFRRSKYSYERIISWNRTKEIGILNPAAALLLNEIVLCGAAEERMNRLPLIENIKQKLILLEAALEKGENLFEALSFVWKKGYGWLMPEVQQQREFCRYLSFFWENVDPGKEQLCKAVEYLEKSIQCSTEHKRHEFILYWLEFWLNKEETDERIGRALFMLHYCGVAIYNHLGDWQKAIFHYERCKGISSTLGVIPYLELRLRGAESYVNIFSYKQANEITKKNCELLEKRKICYQEMAKQLSIPPDIASHTSEYGKNLSASGRYCAFLGAQKCTEGKQQKAKWYFRESLRYFTAALEQFRYNKKEYDRVCNYIFQMAVASKNAELFEEYRQICLGAEVSTGKKMSLSEQIEILIQDPRPQNTYNLYALLKGIRIFYKEKLTEGSEEIEKFFKVISVLTDDSYKGKTQFDDHPWELVLRHAAILFAEREIAGMETQRGLKMSEKFFQLAVGEGVPKQIYKSSKESEYSTVTVLCLVTKVIWRDYERRYARTAQERKIAEQAEKESMDILYYYLRSHKIRLFSKKNWEDIAIMEERWRMDRQLLDSSGEYVNNVRIIEKRYNLIMSNFFYEYE